jgi:short-subunit dehydrogenase
VLNIASLLALSGSLPPDPLPYRAVYAGAKSFIAVFSRVLAKELEGTPVSIHVCLPGIVESEFHGSRSIGGMSAADVVRAAMASIARKETVCIPPLEDPAMFETLAQAERAIFPSARSQKLAERYRG